jgi:hypothetical protein
MIQLSPCLSTAASSSSLQSDDSLIAMLFQQEQQQQQQKQLLQLACTDFEPLSIEIDIDIDFHNDPFLIETIGCASDWIWDTCDQTDPLLTPSRVFTEEEPALPPTSMSLHSIESTTSSKKRPLEQASSTGTSTEPLAQRFKPHQSDKWDYMLEQLQQYRTTTGHCNVPRTHHENLALACWVKRQRYQYKLMLLGKSTVMTTGRVKTLESIGFCWDSQGAAWFERFHDLKEYHSIFGHSNVTINHNNTRLATWIKCQRRQMKFLKQGKPSSMSPFRQQELEKLGFEWELRCTKKGRANI